MHLLEPFARYKAAKYSMTKSDLRQETSRPADLGWDYGCKPFPFTRFLSTVPLSTPFPATKQTLPAIIQRLWGRCYLIQWSMHMGGSAIETHCMHFQPQKFLCLVDGSVAEW